MRGVIGGLIHKGIALITASVMALTGFFSPSSITINGKPTEPSPITNISGTSTTELANALAQLQNRIGGVATTSLSSPVLKPTSKVAAQPAIQPKSKPAVKTSGPAPKRISAGSLALLNADQLLKRTSYALHQNPDGTYWMGLKVNLSDWGLPDLKGEPSQPTVGGTNGIVSFNSSFDCNPPYNVSQFISSPISFDIRTPYACALTLTNSMGQVSKKEIDFTTGIGFLTVSGARGSSDLLKSDISGNNISFNNTDDDPVTITGLTMGVSSTALNFGPGATVKFKDYNDNVLYQYNLADTPQDSSRQYGTAASNIKVPLSLVVPPRTSKVLFIEADNVSFLYVDSDPTLALSVSNITFDRSDMKISLFQNPIRMSWTCSAQYLQDNPDRMCH